MSTIEVTNVSPSGGTLFVTGTLSSSAGLQCGGDATIGGSLTVYGATTTIDTTQMVIEDPLIVLAKNVTSAPTFDAGLIIERGSSINAAFIWDESLDEFATITTTEVGTTTGSIAMTNYAPLRVSDLNVTGSAALSGDLTVDTNTLFVDASENRVGIGTTAPNTKLHVAGEITIDSESAIRWENGNNQIYGSGDSGTSYIDVATSGISRMRITSTGNIGIGVTDPDELLEVAGDAKVSGANKLYFYDTGGEYISSDGTDLTIAAGTAINLNTGVLDLSSQTVDVTLNNVVDALNLDSNTLSIDASNNRVGIGTAAPNAKLHVAGEITIDSDNAIRWENSNNQIYGSGDSGDSYIDVATGGTSRIRITSAGNVGIGTTSPSSSLEIEGSSGDLAIELDNNATNSANLKITSGAGNNRVDLVANALTGNPLALADTTITMKDQRVGIMTTSPEYTLDVVGNGRFTGNLIVSGTLDAHVADFKVTADTMTFGDASGDTVTFNASTVSTPNGLNFDSNTLVIDASNNRIGIGTASPESTLEIEGSSGDLIFEIDNNASNSANFQIQNGAGNARVDIVMNDGAATTITMKGQKVGIMDTSPSYTLDVNGTLRAVGAATFDAGASFGDNVGIGVTDPDEQLELTGRIHLGQTSAPGTTTDKLYNVSGALYWNGVDISTSAAADITGVTAGTGLSGGGTSGTVSLSVDAAQTQITSVGTLSSLTITGDLTVDTSTLFVDASENRVGIGTTSPAHTFHADAGINANATIGAFEGSNPGENKIWIGAADSANNSMVIGYNYAGGLNSANNYGYLINHGDSPGTGITIADAGKVGIGTTTPGSTLEVNGDAQFTHATATAPGGAFDIAGAVTSYVSKINGEIETTLLIDLDGISCNGDYHVIGESGGTNASITQITTATNGVIYKGYMACIEAPAAESGTVASNLNLSHNSSALNSGTELLSQNLVAPGLDWVVGKRVDFSTSVLDDDMTNEFLHLKAIPDVTGEYSAGKFIIKIYGASF